MKGSTETSQINVRVLSNNPKTIRFRQERLMRQTNQFSPARLDSMAKRKGMDAIQKTVYLEKTLIKERRTNDLYRDVRLEYFHTLVKEGVNPVKVQMMSRDRARKLNYFNRKNGIELIWVMGKQKIPTC